MATVFDPDVVALDAQALREGAWPHPNALLRQVGDLARQLGKRLWLVQGALDEVRGNARRSAVDALEDLRKATEAATRLGLRAEVSAGTPEETLKAWDSDDLAARSQLGGVITPHTSRNIVEFFRMAVDRVPPFGGKGRGFRDAVIYASVSDHLANQGLTSAILVTQDRDFANCTPLSPGQEIAAMGLTATIENLQTLLGRVRKDTLDKLMRENDRRRELAAEAIRRSAALIETFASQNLRISSGDVPWLVGTLKRPLSYHFGQVVSVSVSPLFEDVESGRTIDASAVIEFTGELEIVPFVKSYETKLGIGEDFQKVLEHAALLSLLSPGKQSTAVVSGPVLVSVDLQLTRESDGYGGLVVSRLRPMEPAMRGLINAIQGDPNKAGPSPSQGWPGLTARNLTPARPYLHPLSQVLRGLANVEGVACTCPCGSARHRTRTPGGSF